MRQEPSEKVFASRFPAGLRDMTPAERKFALKVLDESRDRLFSALGELSPEQLQYPAPGRWSVAGNIEHLILVENFVLRTIEVFLQRDPDSVRGSDWQAGDESLIARVAGRAGRATAPDASHPTGRWPQENLLQEFDAARAITREFAASTRADLRSHFFPHFALGRIDCYQWLLFIAAHSDRHRAQSEEVMASPDFPAPKNIPVQYER